MSCDYLEKVKKPGQQINRLFNFLEVEIGEISKEKAELGLKAKKDFLQGGCIVAGGILATMLDEAMAHVVLANLSEGEKTVTIDMNVSYLKAVNDSDYLLAEGRIIRRGRRVIYVEADIRLESGAVAAKATASFLVWS